MDKYFNYCLVYKYDKIDLIHNLPNDNPIL